MVSAPIEPSKTPKNKPYTVAICLDATGTYTQTFTWPSTDHRELADWQSIARQGFRNAKVDGPKPEAPYTATILEDLKWEEIV
jgi:hypothetical protein